MTRSLPPPTKKLSAPKQRRLHELLEKNSEGTITRTEALRLAKLVNEAEQLMVENARRLAEFVDGEGNVAAGAVPVTVWVRPEPAER